MGVVAVAFAIASLLPWRAALAQDEAAALAEDARLAAEFSDPLTTLPQLFVQDAFTPKNYGTDAIANRAIARLIVPRVPETSLLPFVQLIRPSFSWVTLPAGRGSETHSAFGDVQLIDLVVLPWSAWKDEGLLLGAGPVFVFPTASEDFAGQGAWQVGPAFASIYKGIPGLVVGGLVQNPISFAYTDSDRDPVSALLFQPILLAYLGRGFYVKSADSTWAMSWYEEGSRTLPVSLGLGYVALRRGWPPMNYFVSGEWMAYRENAPVAAQFTLRLGVTVAFPQWRPW